MTHVKLQNSKMIVFPTGSVYTDTRTIAMRYLNANYCPYKLTSITPLEV